MLLKLAAAIVIFLVNLLDRLLFYALICVKGRSFMPRDLQALQKHEKKCVFVEGSEATENETRAFRHPESVTELLSTYDKKITNLGLLLKDAVSKYKKQDFMGTRKMARVEQVDSKLQIYHMEPRVAWQTYEQVDERIQHIAQGIVHTTGLNSGDKFAIAENTSQDWFMTAQALLRYNITVVTMYATLGDEAMVAALNETRITALLTNESLLPKFFKLRELIPSLKFIFTTPETIPNPTKCATSGERADIDVFSLREIEEIGSKLNNPPAVKLEADRESLALIMYTSGTTGTPKGVMITHGNIMSAVVGVGYSLELDPAIERVYVGYLPLAHIFEFVSEHYIAFMGGKIGYGNPRTLTDRAAKPAGDLSTYRPTLFIGVPRVFDTIKKGIIDMINDTHGSAIKRWLFNEAFKAKRTALHKKMDTPLWNKLVFSTVSKNVGGRMSLMVSGGAALNKDTQEFMRICFGNTVCQGYGLTETCAALTVQSQTDEFSVGNIGGPVRCAEVKLVSVPDMDYLASRMEGEICVRGPHVAQGYYRQEQLSAEVFREHGWFSTGDIGRLNEDGSLSIVDRKKNLVKLDTGEYVALERLETILGNSAYVSPNGICVYGDSSRSFLVALILPNPKALMQWAASQNIECHNDLDKLVRESKVVKHVLDSLEQEATRAKFNSFERIRTITLLNDEWTAENDLLTPSLKLQRSKLAKRYSVDIERMYSTGK